MSDMMKTDDSVTDTQDTFFENPENDVQTAKQFADASNTSQDFQLFIVETEEFSQKISENNEKNKKQDNGDAIKNRAEDKLLDQDVIPETLEKNMETMLEKEQLEKIKLIKSPEIVQEIEKEIPEDEDDEIIQGTPPESPSKNQISFLKRKIEPFKEVASKLARTSSSEGAFSTDREKIDENDIFVQETDDVLTSLQKSTDASNIIPETQESMWTTQSVPTSQSEIEADVDKNMENDAKDVMKDTEEKATTDPVEDNIENVSNEKEKDQIFNNSIEMISEHEEKENVEEKQIIIIEDNDMENKETVQNEKESVSCENENISMEENKLDDNEVSEEMPAKQLEDEEDSLRLPVSESKIEDSTEKITSIVECYKNEIEETVKEVTEEKNEISTKTVPGDVISNGNEDSTEQKIEEIKSYPVDNESQKKDQNSMEEIKDVCKSRMSIELIFDGKSLNQERKEKLMEIVEIDEDGEKIILDSSQEDKNKTQDSNQPSEKTIKQTENEEKADIQFKEKDKSEPMETEAGIISNVQKLEVPVVNISDSEGDVSMNDEALKNKSLADTISPQNHSASTKTVQVEREICMFVRLKCLLNLDETTREALQKELISVHCEAALPRSRMVSDTSTCTADISGNDGNKDASSPGSTTSNQHPFLLKQKPPSKRLSTISNASSSSSASSAASLAVKMRTKEEVQFSLPRVPRSSKHTKKMLESTPEDGKSTEQFERVIKDWKNVHLLTMSVLNVANSELNNVDDFQNGSSSDPIEQIDTSRRIIPSSTPETVDGSTSSTLTLQNTLQSTPKSTKKRRPLTKRSRSGKNTRSSKSNGYERKISPNLVTLDSDESKPLEKNENKIKIESTSRSATPVKQIKSAIALRNISMTPTQSDFTDDELLLLQKQVFAKWSDNNYYPGYVKSKDKSKYKVHFYDGQDKLLIEDFIVPITAPLAEGLSVYATTDERGYASPGIIIGVSMQDDEEVLYTIELDDEREQVKVPITNISLTADQIQVLKEEMSILKPKSLPSTPQHLSHVTLDNMVDGKRRSKRIATPTIFQTPKSRQESAKEDPEASGSGISKKLETEEIPTARRKRELLATSDSNCSGNEEPKSHLGIQDEIISTPNQNVYKVKGSKTKGKLQSKGKKKISEDRETIEVLGPVPQEGSSLFNGMFFILTCASAEGIDRYQQITTTPDSGTDNEEEWLRIPFVREYLNLQIENGGGHIYDKFEEIPQSEYYNTKLITNLPNTTAKSILCLSVGISAVSHKWIIRCCRENKIINIAEETLPAGWSLEKQSYVETYQRPSNNPLNNVIVVIPVIESEKEFATFWYKVCENAGATVLIVDNPKNSFIEGTAILTTKNCPSWVLRKASEWQIPLVSTVWIMQCLIEGKVCLHESHPHYHHTYVRS